MVKIIAVTSRKGGTGKTTVAQETANALDGVLADFDWDEGGATRSWGYRWEKRVESPVLQALAHDRVPRPLKGYRKPMLLPSHPDYATELPEGSVVADSVLRWGEHWGKTLGKEWVVIDTHPGSADLTNALLAIAHVVVAPVPLKEKEMAATEAMVKDLADYPLVLVPYMIPAVPPVSMIRRLENMIAGTPVQVGPFVPYAAAVGRRTKRMAMTAEERPARALLPVVEGLRNVAEYVKEYVS
ncbi:ParA family protein [Microbacterium sp. NPDC089698]|uniref:ParA family protein n=1 Tax=Microbacterium sp. NPDC089698 TaxID=3364200 RepID=UPI00382B38BE